MELTAEAACASLIACKLLQSSSTSSGKSSRSQEVSDGSM